MFGNRDFYGIFNNLHFRNFTGFDLLRNHHGLNGKKSITPSPKAPESSQSTDSAPDSALSKSVTKPVTDTIEKAQATRTPATADNLPGGVYTPETLLKALLNQPASAQPSDQPQDQTETVQTEKKWFDRVDLNLNFNMAQFEQTISRLAEDAQDGELDSATFTNLNIGLHVDLKAKAATSETIQTNSGDNQTNEPIGVETAKIKTRQKQAMAIKMQARNFEAAMFYRESEKTRFRMRKESGDGFMRVSQKLAMRYTQDFSFNFKSLNLYNSQAAELDKTGDIESYINTTESLVDNQQVPGDLIGQFFGLVNEYLNGAEDKIIDKINGFFDNLSQQLGIESQYLDQSREALIGHVNAFFDKVEQATSSVMDKYINAGQSPEQIPEPTTPAIEEDVADTSGGEPAPVEENAVPVEEEAVPA
jgi:hypothetical protein